MSLPQHLTASQDLGIGFVQAKASLEMGVLFRLQETIPMLSVICLVVVEIERGFSDVFHKFTYGMLVLADEFVVLYLLFTENA